MSAGRAALEGARGAFPHIEPDRASDVDVLELFLNEVGRYPLLDAAEEIELGKRIERGDRSAKDTMINSNLRLVVSLAKRYQTHQLPLLDVIQEGILGLIRATEKFDWRRGHKFSTYAVWWIRESIDRGVSNRSRLIRMPVYMIERERKVRNTERTLTAELGRDPTEQEIADAARLPLAQVRDLREGARAVTSLDMPVGENDELSLGDMLVCEEAQPPEQVEVSMQRESLLKALGKLPERERQVVKLRYGIDGTAETIEAVVRRLGISRDRVRRLESQALARLARSADMVGLQRSA
jgi:RNA polymerase primary sigma factor